MTMDTNEWLKSKKSAWRSRPPHVRRPILCKDGFSVFIQASEAHRCEPRDNNGPYTAVELGYPNRVDSLITAYAENEEYLNTVYPCVPVEIVDALIAKHGGIKI